MKPSDSTGTKCTIEQRIKGKTPKRKISRARITQSSQSSINKLRVNSALVQNKLEVNKKLAEIIEPSPYSKIDQNESAITMNLLKEGELFDRDINHIT